MLDQTFIEALRAEAQEFKKIFDEQRALDAAAQRNPFPTPSLEESADAKLWLKYLSNAADMLRQPIENIDNLVEPLLPRSGVAALVGTSDSGKSCFLRGLAMAIAEGRGDFAGFRLKPLHRRAIYISTEDDAQSVAALMKRQISELGTTVADYEGLDFIFDSSDLLATLDAALTERPADIVIVDAFADLYTGALNENNRVRGFLQQFQTLAVRHTTLFVFLHHTSKRSEVLTPSKHNAIGSQGFEAKMRLMMELRPDPERYDIRHLCVVKGNYLPSEYKHDSFELRFTEGLNYEATGERVPFEMLRERDPEKEEADGEKLALIRTMREEGKTLREIADALGFKSHTTVRRKLQEAM